MKAVKVLIQTYVEGRHFVTVEVGAPGDAPGLSRPLVFLEKVMDGTRSVVMDALDKARAPDAHVG